MLVAHALVPPLASAYGAESNAWWSLPLKPAVLEKHFVYSKEAVRRGRWWTVVSYMFLHADYAHLFSNLQGLMLSGPGALEVFGPLGERAARFSPNFLSLSLFFSRACKRHTRDGSSRAKFVFFHFS